ncbi:unnamed protein product [Thelazia callipaeda]|uniref:ANK_REP_REGION domain-containing protein n=1 Tax=Thelazia callipaeda TaxID=103827 RepID=A0A0N5CRY3_THECL|nr:unnamed protein product [Thelazia callipaeda]
MIQMRHIRSIHASMNTSPESFVCTVCRAPVGRDRNDFISHYKCDWHRHNLRRIMQGRPLLTEEELEQNISNDNEVSSLDTESDNEVLPFSSGSHSYFICDGMVYSIYRCILKESEMVSADLFSRPLNCAILMLSGGHFCGGIFRNNQLIIQKSFHRYVVRAKQGTTQSLSDNRGRAAKSAGALMRKYNEKALKNEIQRLLASWSKLLEETALIFLRCSTLQRHIFFEATKGAELLDKMDKRMRTIPFETRRPTVEELQRTWSRLKIVRFHGSLDDFNNDLERRIKLRKKQRRIFRKKISQRSSHLSDEFSESDVDDNFRNQRNNSQRIEVVNDKLIEKTVSKQGEKSCGGNVILDKVDAQAVYCAIRLNSVPKLRQLLEMNKDRIDDFLKYIREIRFPPAESTFLHIASIRGTVEILEELLLLRCDPALKDGEGKVPFQVAQSKTVRQVFMKFRSEHPDAFDWNMSQIPELVIYTQEQLAREEEKKKIQREKKKQRNKAKKAAKYLEKKEQEQRQIYLALPDSQKRALVAERRLAVSLQKSCQIVENDGNRCFKCGVVLDSQPFEYCNNCFCSLPCLQEHRKEQPLQLLFSLNVS